MTINHFSPNRRYSSDKKPGGPTREFKEMVKTFHDEGIKVFLDVVYNHTGEGLLKRNINNQGNPTSKDEIEKAKQDVRNSSQDSNAACYLSYAGLDNQSYYFLSDGNQKYETHGNCGGNLNYCEPVVRGLIIDSLKYWAHEMGVDGFRFDLAPILSLTGPNNSCSSNTQTNIFQKISNDIPSRSISVNSGVDLIAEPWGYEDDREWKISFPPDWAVWNDTFRNNLKIAMNKYGISPPLPIWKIASSLAGSDFIHKSPWNSINYLVSHDDCNCLRNIFSYNKFIHLENTTEQDQASWDQGGDIEL